MASKFRKYAGNTCEALMYGMYSYIANSGQTAWRFVNDTGSAIALLKFGTGFVTTWSSSSDCPDGSYFVIEPVTAIGGVRPQVKILNTAADVISAEFAPRGGWTNASSFGAAITTGAIRFNDASAPGAGSQVYCGGGTWAIDGSNTATYIWFNIRDSGSLTADQMMYCGGYTPWDITTDVNPCVFLARVPTVQGATFDFGRNSADTNNLNRTSVEFAQTTSWASAGYARIGQTDAPVEPGATCIWRDKNNKYPPLPAFVWTRNSSLDGYIGDHMRLITTTLTDYDVDDVGAPTRMVLGHLWMHYDESL